MQKIEKLQGELASATASIAELEKGKAAAQAAQKEAAKARRDAETARREVEQAAATERAKLQKRLAQLEADGTAPAKNKRWENALYGSMGGLLIVLIASAIGFFLKRYNARTSGTGATDTSAQLQSNAAEVETFVASPAIAIAEDAFGRELEPKPKSRPNRRLRPLPRRKAKRGRSKQLPPRHEDFRGRTRRHHTILALP
jgi:ribosomal protein L9